MNTGNALIESTLYNTVNCNSLHLLQRMSSDQQFVSVIETDLSCAYYKTDRDIFKKSTEHCLKMLKTVRKLF